MADTADVPSGAGEELDETVPEAVVENALRRSGDRIHRPDRPSSRPGAVPRRRGRDASRRLLGLRRSLRRRLSRPLRSPRPTSRGAAGTVRGRLQLPEPDRALTTACAAPGARIGSESRRRSSGCTPRPRTTSVRRSTCSGSPSTAIRTRVASSCPRTGTGTLCARTTQSVAFPCSSRAPVRPAERGQLRSMT